MCSIFETIDLTKEQKKTYVRSKTEINKDLKSSRYTYIRNDIIEKVIKDCRTINDKMNRLDKAKKRQNFRELLGFKENQIFETKEYSIIKQIKKVFIRQKIIDQYRVEKYFIDLYFPELKLGIEID